MDFYSKYNKNADSQKLVKVGKITSVVVIVLAAFWAPQIGKFGSLLKYYQEMLSYIAPPIVAAFIIGIFNKRVNGTGAFVGLMSGLAIAIAMVFFKTSIFGNLHFLLIVPYLFVFSLLIIYITSLFFAKPAEDKLTETTFSMQDFKNETQQLKSVVWHSNYRIWAGVLLFCCAVIWIYFS